MDTDTIAAIATGTGGGVGIVRLSGPLAVEIAAEIFVPVDSDKQVTTLAGYTCTLGRIMDGDQVLDQALLLLFRAPRSYTGEDLVELSCHGGRLVLEEVLALCIRHGAQPAARGEFTKRAFLNGKLDLTEAEAVADIVAAQSSQGLRAAQMVREGALFERIQRVTAQITDAAAHIAAWTDYPEEDVEDVLFADLRRVISEALAQLKQLGAGYNQGRMIRQGIATAIVGSPNVGKSTLMNLLAGYDRSIVTDIPGTTRDVIEETVRLDDLTLTLMDTAGLRQTGDRVEQLGVERSRESLNRCDLVLAVFDNSQALSPEDMELLASLEGRLAVGIINKTDLAPAVDKETVARYTSQVVEISARDETGIPDLREAIRRVAGLENLDPAGYLVAGARQLSCITGAGDALREALESLDDGITLDAVSVCIQESLDHLMALTGLKTGEEIIDKVFEQFCVGK